MCWQRKRGWFWKSWAKPLLERTERGGRWSARWDKPLLPSLSLSSTKTWMAASLHKVQSSRLSQYPTYDDLRPHVANKINLSQYCPYARLLYRSIYICAKYIRGYSHIFANFSGIFQFSFCLLVFRLPVQSSVDCIRLHNKNMRGVMGKHYGSHSIWERRHSRWETGFYPGLHNSPTADVRFKLLPVCVPGNNSKIFLAGISF